MSPAKATHQLTKQHNRDLVLQTIIERQQISRAEIARLTDLTRATVSDLVAELIAEGLVEEIGFGSSMGGKAPILLSLVADSRFLIGLNLAQDRFAGAVINLRGEIKELIEAPISDSNGSQALELVYQILAELLNKGWRPIVGIGIGTPGLVNTTAGLVINAVNLDWRDLPLGKLIEERFQIPVSVMNDSQANAIGEFIYGANHTADSHLVVFNIRQGLGAGILINGRLFQGDGGGAGEIGHVVVQENGAMCRCGKRGCLETVASARAIVQRAAALAADFPESTLNGVEVSLETLAAAFAAHDPLAEQVLGEAADALGMSIAHLIGALNIHNIILTGDLVQFGGRWLELVKAAVERSAFARLAQDTCVQFGDLGGRGCVLGASAYMLLDGYSLLFTSPAEG